MTWKYDQSSGVIYHNGETVAIGYSGFREGKNNPNADKAKGIGPIPNGKWRITGHYDSSNVGPFALILEPKPGTETFGRSAFRIHGDSAKNPGGASRGCIILPRRIREKIWESGDRDLEVVD